MPIKGGIRGRRSDKCFKVAMEQSKSPDPLDQALSQINQIVGMVNRRQEDLTSGDLQKNAAENLEAYLNTIEGGEDANLEAPLHLRDDSSYEQGTPALRSPDGEAHIREAEGDSKEEPR